MRMAVRWPVVFSRCWYSGVDYKQHASMADGPEAVAVDFLVDRNLYTLSSSRYVPMLPSERPY